KGIEGGLTRLGNTAHELGLKMRQTGREISYVGSSMVMAGTAITAPLIAAYKEAGKYNNDIAQQLYETKNVFQNLAVSIGTSLLPVMKQLTDMVARAVDWWNNLDKVTRDRLIQNIFKLGETLIGLGFALVVVGKSITFLANLALLASTLLALDPIIVGIVGGIGLLAIGMIKFKVVADA
ncbi:MAG: hypothetical protein NTY47_01700, partial [Candidatus Omnitrophica bacterium]|nr:hypothetical protein [Candidatus Omnitrophota bacterium]